MILENHQQIENVKEYYEILRTRQIQIIQIIKETTELLARIEAQPRLYGLGAGQMPEKKLDNGLQLAFSMINSLANILDEQMKALNVWERILENENSPARSNVDYGFQDYYEITSN